jgi:hypothetical protein
LSSSWRITCWSTRWRSWDSKSASSSQCPGGNSRWSLRWSPPSTLWVSASGGDGGKEGQEGAWQTCGSPRLRVGERESSKMGAHRPILGFLSSQELFPHPLIDFGKNAVDSWIWVDGWMGDGWMDGWIEGWMSGWIDGWIEWRHRNSHDLLPKSSKVLHLQYLFPNLSLLSWTL